jgi:hypothetical protein
VFGAAQTLVLLVFRDQPGTVGGWLWLDLALFASLVPVGVLGALAALRADPRTTR